MAMTSVLAATAVLATPPCGTTIDADTARLMLGRQAQGLYAPTGGVAAGTTYLIPITVHVIRHSNGTGGQDPIHAASFIDAANTEFADAGMTFAQLGPTRFVDNSSFLGAISTISGIWLTDNVPGTVNVYFGGGYAGFCGAATLTSADTRGVLLNDVCDFNDPIDPSVLSHELGHYFDLFHTHEDAFGLECPDGSNCAVAGDLLCDTPADPDQLLLTNAACEYVGQVLGPCDPPMPYMPDVTNLMSNSPQLCYNTFTPQQIERMRASLLNLQPELALDALPDLAFDPPAGVRLVSVASSGQRANTDAHNPEISGDGRYVVFHSFSGTLVADDDNFQTDSFRHDLHTNETIRLSVNTAGEQTDSRADAPAISVDGRYVAFASFGSNLAPDNPGDFIKQIYRRDTVLGRTNAVSQRADGTWCDSQCLTPQVSDDGLTVVFWTDGDSLAPGSGSFWGNIFCRDMMSGDLEIINVDNAGEPQHDFLFADTSISADGRFVGFTTRAALVPEDGNSRLDVYVRDRALGVTKLVSVGSSGFSDLHESASPSLSADGRYVAFHSLADLDPSSGVGAGINRIYVRDRMLGITRLISVNSSGTPADGDSSNARISRDARFVVFSSQATNLSPRDGDVVADVYRHDRLTGHTVLASRSAPGTPDTVDGPAQLPAVSGDGRIVVYRSVATNVAPMDLNGGLDVFAVDVDEVLRSDGDVNGDGHVDVDDLVAVILAWGPCPAPCPEAACPADLDQSCAVDVDDLVAVIVGWS